MWNYCIIGALLSLQVILHPCLALPSPPTPSQDFFPSSIYSDTVNFESNFTLDPKYATLDEFEVVRSKDKKYSFYGFSKDLVSSRMMAGNWEAEMNYLFTLLWKKEVRRRENIPSTESKIVLDLGVNFGAFFFHAASLGCKVVGFEMQPKLFHAVEMGSRLSKFTNNAHLYNNAVWYRRKELSFTPNFYSKRVYNLGHTPLLGDKSGTHVINTTRVDSIISNKKVKIFFLKIDVERAEPQAMIGMNSLFLSHRVENVVFEVNHPSEIEIMFDIGYGCSAIDDWPRCSYSPNSKQNRINFNVTDREYPRLGRHSLQDECFFYNKQQASLFFETHQPPKRRGYHNVHCFLKSNAPPTDFVIQEEADKFQGKLLSYDGSLFSIERMSGKPFLKEQIPGNTGVPSLPVVAASFRTMFLIESDIK